MQTSQGLCGRMSRGVPSAANLARRGPKTTSTPSARPGAMFTATTIYLTPTTPRRLYVPLRQAAPDGAKWFGWTAFHEAFS